jgi:hypothetical protein
MPLMGDAPFEVVLSRGTFCVCLAYDDASVGLGTIALEILTTIKKVYNVGW